MTPLVLDLTPGARGSLFALGLFGPLVAAVALYVARMPAVAVVDGPVVVGSAGPCDASRLDGTDGCGSPEHCVAGRCERLRFPARAGPGSACAGTLCAPGLECFADVCVAPDELPLAPPLCRAAEVQAAVLALRRKCEGQQDLPGASLDDCEVASWEKISTSDPNFVELLGKLPGVFTVHFPADRPDPAGRWATTAVRGIYRTQLARRVRTLRPARQILVIGRASHDGTGERNRELAQRRSELVASLLAELLPGGPPLRRWSLASSHGLAPERFKLDVQQTPVTWSNERTEWLTGALAEDLKRLPGPEWREVHDTINRVVLVVPLHCAGTEFQPHPTFQGFEEVES